MKAERMAKGLRLLTTSCGLDSFAFWRAECSTCKVPVTLVS